MNNVEILEGAVEIVKQGWVQGNLAEDSDGNCVSPDDDKACSWCLIGSLIKAGNVVNLEDLIEVVHAIRAEIRMLSLIEWNDAHDRTQQDVVEMIERTKKRVKESF